MKILAAGDIHGDSKLTRDLARQASKEKVDLVVLCGDLTIGDEPVKDLISPFKKKNLKVLLLPGNHDSLATADFLADFYGMKNMHGYSIRHKDIGLFGCSGVNLGPEQMSESEIFRLLKQSHDYMEKVRKKIMITHTHPSETKADDLSFVPGSSGITKAIKTLKPDILLCSHAHEAEGIEEKMGKTKIIHVGRKGKIIKI